MQSTSFPNRAACPRSAQETDRALLEILRDGGRQIGRVFAERAELSEATVSRRLSLLKESNLVTARAYVDPIAVGCNAISMIRYSTKDAPHRFAQWLSERSCCYRVASVAGRNEIVALVALENDGMILKKLDQMLGEHPELSIVDAAAVVTIIPPREARGVVSATLLSAARSMTPRQRLIQSKLIRALQRDFRASLASLAADTGVSAPAVAATLSRMISLGEVRFVVDADPRFLNRPLCAQIRVAVRSNIESTANEIAEKLNPDWIFVCLARKNLVIETSVHDEAELLRFGNEVLKFPFVDSVECQPFDTVFKQDFNWSASPTEDAANPTSPVC